MNYKYILTAILVMSVFSGTASAWLTGYDHRMAITVNNGGTSNLSYYQFNFTNDTNVLVSAGEMQASGVDCRITDASDNLLPFWNETPFNATGTEIWVNATTLAVGNNTFYVYYGNAGASSVVAGDNTFELFDDFSNFQVSPVFTRDTLWSGDPCDGFGMSYISPNDPNKMIYFYRNGPEHDVNELGKINRAIYNISADSWSGQGTNVWNSTETGIADRQASGGVIGTKTFVFNTRYNTTASAWYDIQVLTTTDDGTNFVLNQTIIPAGNWSWFQVWGHLIQADSGKWMIPVYEKNSDDNTTYIKLIESIDGGATWTIGTTIASSASEQYTEADIVNVGDGRLLALFRNDFGDPLTQCTSTDNGSTWGSPQLTNIYDTDASYQHSPSMIYDTARDMICLIYVCFNTDKHWYLEVDPDDVFSSPTSYPSAELIDSGSSYANNPLITKIAPSKYYLLWSTGFDTTVVYGGVKHIANAKWAVVTGNTPTASGGKITVDDGWIRTLDAFGTGYTSRCRGKMSITTVAQQYGFSNKTALGTSNDITNYDPSISLYWTTSGNTYITNNYAGSSSQYTGGTTDTSYHTFEITRNSTTDTYFKIDDVHYANSPISTSVPISDAFVHLLDYQTSAGSAEYDWIFVRKYTYPDPTSSLGAEETGGGGCGAYNITLPLGWSIIGWTNPTASTAHAMGTSIGGNCQYVTERNSTTGQYVTHVMSNPTEDDFAIERGWGYFVKTTAETLWERDS